MFCRALGYWFRWSCCALITLLTRLICINLVSIGKGVIVGPAPVMDKTPRNIVATWIISLIRKKTAGDWDALQCGWAVGRRACSRLICRTRRWLVRWTCGWLICWTCRRLFCRALSGARTTIAIHTWASAVVRLSEAVIRANMLRCVAKAPKDVHTFRAADWGALH